MRSQKTFSESWCCHDVRRINRLSFCSLLTIEVARTDSWRCSFILTWSSSRMVSTDPLRFDDGNLLRSLWIKLSVTNGSVIYIYFQMIHHVHLNVSPLQKDSALTPPVAEKFCVFFFFDSLAYHSSLLRSTMWWMYISESGQQLANSMTSQWNGLSILW